MRALMLLILLGLAAGIGAVSAGVSGDARSLATVLDSRSAPEAERQRALSALRALAAGEQGARETREATFVLAEHFGRNQAKPDATAIQTMGSAAALYPDDPRVPALLRRLGVAQMEAGDPFAAHLSFAKLLGAGGPVEFPLLSRAIVNAVEVGDMPAAFEWSSRVPLASLGTPENEPLLLARLEAASALGKTDAAASTAAELERISPEGLRANPAALLAAARAEEALGRLRPAVSRYEAFANIHTKHTDRPAALLALGRLEARLGKPKAARLTFDWLLKDHPSSTAANLARLERLDTESGSGSANAYLDAARAAARGSDAASSKDACDRLLARLIGEGHPLEAVTALARLASEQDGIAPMAARESLSTGIAPALELLASRGDDLSLAAASLEAEAAGIAIPARQLSAVSNARSRLGLGVAGLSSLDLRIDESRPAAKSGRWAEVRARLEEALAVSPDAPAPSRARALGLLAEALWREGSDADALARVGEALTLANTPADQRPLRVLEADILFATGKEEDACALYFSAMSVSRSAWVDAQMERCGTAATAGETR